MPSIAYINFSLAGLGCPIFTYLPDMGGLMHSFCLGPGEAERRTGVLQGGAFTGRFIPKYSECLCSRRFTIKAVSLDDYHG